LTEGYACHNPECEYCGNTDSQVHALVADGDKLTQQGLVKQIKCQGCGSKFLVTRNTAMYSSKLTVERVGEINRGLAEGLSISACARVFGHSRSTIHRIARVSGEHFQSLHELLLQGIQAVHVQMDELRAKLKGKVEAVWTWVSMEATNKLMLAVEVGHRTQDNAYALVHKTVGCLAKGCIPTYATDGLNQYFYALSAHHGGWRGAETVLRAEGETGHRHRHTKCTGIWRVDPHLHYGQVIKRYARRKLRAITRKMMLGSQEAFRSALQAAGLSGRINTAYIERLNLGLRTGVSALIRRSASAVCSEAALARRVEIYRAIYHFVRPHAGLRLGSPVPLLCTRGRSCRRFEPRTPAMAAGLTNRVWSMEQLLLHPVPPKTPPRHQPRRLSPAS
jgi:transposase-like protein/IS1 family transposase